MDSGDAADLRAPGQDVDLQEPVHEKVAGQTSMGLKRPLPREDRDPGPLPGEIPEILLKS